VAERRADVEASAAMARACLDHEADELEAYLHGQCLALLALLEEDHTRALAELTIAMEHVRRGNAVSVGPYRGLWPLVAALAGRDPRPIEPSTLSVVRGLTCYAEAVLAGREGAAAAASVAWRRGEEHFERLLSPGYHQLGRRLVAPAALRDGWGDGVEWLTEAGAWFGGAGYSRVSDACRALLRQAGIPQRRRGRGAATVPPQLADLGVTSREVDVLCLVATGLSNREIAERLYVSPATVKTHVSRLLDKTGHGSRAQLVAMAVAVGLGVAPAPASATPPGETGG
jgi:DNA-binding CsgD family transcriptional regulator